VSYSLINGWSCPRYNTNPYTCTGTYLFQVLCEWYWCCKVSLVLGPWVTLMNSDPCPDTWQPAWAGDSLSVWVDCCEAVNEPLIPRHIPLANHVPFIWLLQWACWSLCVGLCIEFWMRCHWLKLPKLLCKSLCMHGNLLVSGLVWLVWVLQGKFWS